MFRRPQPSSRFRLPLVMALLVALLSSFAARPASAQQRVTPALLIGDSVSQPDSPRYGDISDAIKRFTNRDLPGAQLLLEKAKRKYPKLPPVSVMLAKLYLLTGNAAGVRPALEQSVVEDADDPEPYLLLAEQALAGNRTIEADALFDKAVGLIREFDANPKRKRSFVIRAYKGRAVVDQRRKKWEQAEADLRAWLKEDPENAAAHNQLGSVLIMLERIDEGLKSFGEARELNDKLPNPYVTAGAMLQRRGDTEEALEYFRRAYKEDQSDKTAITQYANALIISDNLREANKVLEAGRKDAPGSFNVLLLSGVSARIGGESKLAERYFLQAMIQKPTNRDVILQLTYVLAARDDDDSLSKAQQYAVMNTRLDEKNADTQVALAWVLEKSGKPREAEAAFRLGLQNGAPSSDGQVLLAKILLNRDRKDDAKQILQNSLTKAKGIFVTKKEAEELLAKL